jgi:DNA-binding transcriptional MerR regulator
MHKNLTKEFYNIFEELRAELGDLPTDCARLMRSYLRYWKEEDEQFTVIDTELDEIVTLPNGLEFRIIVDMVVEDKRTGLLWPFDHKNRKNFASSDNMLVDPQLTNYYTGLETLGYNPLGGVVYNELRTKAPTVPQILTGKGPKQGTLSKAKIDTDVYTYYRAIKDNGLNVADYADILRQLQTAEEERFFKRVRLPKDKTMKRIMMEEAIESALQIKEKRESGRPYVRTNSNQCNWDCDFKTLCIAQLHGGDLKSLIRHGYRSRKETDEAMEKK